jgi:hypothetical protein
MEHIRPQSSGYVTDPAHGHEKTDINIKGVLAFGAVLLFCGLMVHAILWGVYRGLDKYEQTKAAPVNPMVPQETIATHNPNANTMEPAKQMSETSEQVNRRLVATFPEPRLQIDDVRDMNVLRENNDKQMNEYQWIDPKAGSVRIPVERAMDIIAQRGLPNVPTPPPAKANIGIAGEQTSRPEAGMTGNKKKKK